MENKCEKADFLHAWEKIENNIVYATMPPSYPAPQRRCINCGLEQTLVTKQSEVRAWETNH